MVCKADRKSIATRLKALNHTGFAVTHQEIYLTYNNNILIVIEFLKVVLTIFLFKCSRIFFRIHQKDARLPWSAVLLIYINKFDMRRKFFEQVCSAVDFVNDTSRLMSLNGIQSKLI